jgi:hypothetical protein
VTHQEPTNDYPSGLDLMARDTFSGSCRRHASARRQKSVVRHLESLEDRRVFSTSPWVSLADLVAPESIVAEGVPTAEPAVLVATGNPNTDAASLLAAGGPGDSSLPGFANVARSGENGSVIYLGAGWALTANHVSLTSSINFGGTWFTVDTSSVRQLKNADNSSTDLKMFRVQGEPQLPNILGSFLASAPATGHVFMIGNGLTRGQEVFWSVSRAQSPWVWTEISEPAFPGTNHFAGVTIVSPRTIRWGDNMVKESGVYNVGGLNVTGFLTQFDKLKFTGQNGLANEAQASAGDSGGAVFSYVNGQWVLSGVMLAVSGSLSGQPANTALYGNITLMADLSAYRTQILSIVGVADRNIFYNESVFDGNNAAINALDDAAIATDKSAYVAGSGLASTANVTSYTNGINGIMIDLASTHGTISAADFSFKVGTNNSPSTWSVAPAPASISVRPGAGIGGTDRLEIVWANGVIANQWLEVIVKGNDSLGGFNTNTGLAASDVFFWGNRIADSLTSAGINTFDTNTLDAGPAFGTLGGSKPVTDAYDYNRDGIVSTFDAAAVFTNLGSLTRINIVSGGSFAPLADPTSLQVVDGEAASQLVLAAGGEVTIPPPSQTARDAQTRAVARVLSRWMNDESSRGRLRTDSQHVDMFGLEALLSDVLGGKSANTGSHAWLTDVARRSR